MLADARPELWELHSVIIKANWHGQFRMTRLDLSSLQFRPGPGHAASCAVLAVSDLAPRQVPPRICRTDGQSSNPPGLIRGGSSHLDSRRFSRRGPGHCGPGRALAARVSPAPDSDLDHHRYWPGSGAGTFWRREC